MLLLLLLLLLLLIHLLLLLPQLLLLLLLLLLLPHLLLLLLLLLLLWTTAVLGRIRRGDCRRCSSNANDGGAGAVGIMGRCRKAAGLVDVVAAASSMMASGWMDWPVMEWVVDRRTVVRLLPEP